MGKWLRLFFTMFSISDTMAIHAITLAIQFISPPIYLEERTLLNTDFISNIFPYRKDIHCCGKNHWKTCSVLKFSYLLVRKLKQYTRPIHAVDLDGVLVVFVFSSKFQKCSSWFPTIEYVLSAGPDGRWVEFWKTVEGLSWSPKSMFSTQQSPASHVQHIFQHFRVLREYVRSTNWTAHESVNLLFCH